MQRPCADARVEVDYRIRIWTHYAFAQAPPAWVPPPCF